MDETKDGNVRLSIGFWDYGMPGWTSVKNYKHHEPKYDYPLPFDAPKPGTEWKY